MGMESYVDRVAGISILESAGDQDLVAGDSAAATGNADLGATDVEL